MSTLSSQFQCQNQSPSQGTSECTSQSTSQEENSWSVYMLRCNDNSLYTGITTDLTRRIREHNHDNKTGAKYTRVRRPVKLVYFESLSSRSEASQREHQIKRLTKQQKERLIQVTKTAL